VRDPIAIRSLDWVLDNVREKTRQKYGQLVEGTDYRILFHQYGKNGVMGDLEPLKDVRSHEICIVTAASSCARRGGWRRSRAWPSQPWC
jgi:hypothetical protein